MLKQCARCDREFDDTGYEPFITCGRCRIPLPNGADTGGCRYWRDAAPDPRVTRSNLGDFSTNENRP